MSNEWIDAISNKQMYNAIAGHVHYVLNDLGRKTGHVWSPLIIRYTNKRRMCVHTWRRGQPSKLIFGDESVRWSMRHGYTEYARLQYLVRSGQYKGLQALYCIVTHELAHFVHVSRWLAGETHYHKPHDGFYAAIYAELLDNYSMEDMLPHYRQLEVGAYREVA